MPGLQQRTASTTPQPSEERATQSSAEQGSPATEGSPEWAAELNSAVGNAGVVEMVIGAHVDEQQAASELKLDGLYAEVHSEHAERQEGGVYRDLSETQRYALGEFTAHYEKHRARYEKVAAQTDIPAQLVAAIHWREGSGDFSTYLHQGDPLGRAAVNWPSNIPVFHKWEPAAVHALQMKDRHREELGIDQETQDGALLGTYAEMYNGLGYHNRGVSSPYVYAGTSAYSSGKYVADGKYSASARDQQLGVIPMLSATGGLDQPITELTSQTAWAQVRSGQTRLRQGAQGMAVEALQELLGLEVDGDFGPGTDRAVRQFQTGAGLTADGVVGPGTATALEAQRPTT